MREILGKLAHGALVAGCAVVVGALVLGVMPWAILTVVNWALGVLGVHVAHTPWTYVAVTWLVAFLVNGRRYNG